jgi:hypothetical protein
MRTSYFTPQFVLLADFRSSTVFASAGLDVMSYTPPTATLGVQDWPTLGSLITAGTRLITFLDNGADFNSVPWLLNEFTNVRAGRLTNDTALI